MSLNRVTVSDSSISGPLASATVTSDATFTRIVALGPTYTCRAWTGIPNSDDSDRLAQIERDAQSLGEVIERAERQDTIGSLGRATESGLPEDRQT